jgi:hypothetical protein
VAPLLLAQVLADLVQKLDDRLSVVGEEILDRL